MAKLTERWDAYTPSKSLWLWSCVGCTLATMALGFTLGGGTTGGTAAEMVETARSDARAQLVANLCVNEFLASPDAAQNLAALKEARSWARSDFIEEGGWAQVAGLKEQVSAANRLCASQLAAMNEMPARVIGTDITEG